MGEADDNMKMIRKKRRLEHVTLLCSSNSERKTSPPKIDDVPY
ncbi:MAG: hypothetical protein ACJAT3_000728 [Akkermansiaceae bacterium]|jgi:hypothetical protein